MEAGYKNAKLVLGALLSGWYSERDLQVLYLQEKVKQDERLAYNLNVNGSTTDFDIYWDGNRESRRWQRVKSKIDRRKNSQLKKFVDYLKENGYLEARLRPLKFKPEREYRLGAKYFIDKWKQEGHSEKIEEDFVEFCEIVLNDDGIRNKLSFAAKLYRPPSVYELFMRFLIGFLVRGAERGLDRTEEPFDQSNLPPKEFIRVMKQRTSYTMSQLYEITAYLNPAVNTALCGLFYESL